MRNRTSKEFYNNIYMKDNKDCKKFNKCLNTKRLIKREPTLKNQFKASA